MHTTPEPEVRDPKPAAPVAPKPWRRRINVSLETIRQGLQPIAQIKAHGSRPGETRDYFLFANGQVRRQLSEGHSTLERGIRRARTNADYALRRVYKRARRLEAAA